MKKTLSALGISLIFMVSPTHTFALESSTQTVDMDGGSKLVHLVTYSIDEPVQLKPVLANGKVDTVEDFQQMMTESGALAGINGSYFNPYDGGDLQPYGTIMVNGVASGKCGFTTLRKSVH